MALRQGWSSCMQNILGETMYCSPFRSMEDHFSPCMYPGPIFECSEYTGSNRRATIYPLRTYFPETI